MCLDVEKNSIFQVFECRKKIQFLICALAVQRKKESHFIKLAIFRF